VGYVLYAPDAFLPGAAAFPTAPVSPDAVLLTTVYVDPRHGGGGLGRMLVQGMARDLIKRGGVRAVEAFGDTRRPAHAVTPLGRPPGHCVLPADFLGSVGFKTQRAHGTTPRMRMELRSALTWRDEVEAAVDRLVDGGGPPHTPAAGEARDVHGAPPAAGGLS
jgi:GNAT superfamily N-acetyltransferase